LNRTSEAVAREKHEMIDKAIAVVILRQEKRMPMRRIAQRFAVLVSPGDDRMLRGKQDERSASIRMRSVAG